MTSFHESIKDLISDVERFLVETIKKEALSKTSRDHKQTILDKIGRLREEFPQLTPDRQSAEDAKSADQSFTDESSRTGGSSNADDDDQYGDSNIPAIPAQDLTDTIKCGFLEKKQRKGGIFGGPKLQKRWCAIKNSVFYYYESAKEKKQHGAFYLNGYSVEAAPDAVDKKDAAKRELSFQLVCPAKRTYQFVALSKEDYDDWKIAINKGALSATSKENILDDEPGEVYEDVGTGEDAVVEEVYDDTLEEPQPSPKAPVKHLPNIPRPPPPSIPSEPTCDEVYDDTAIIEDDQEEYDDCLAAAAAQPPPPPTPNRSLPEIPGSPRKPLPSIPPTPPPSGAKPLPNIPAPEVPRESKPEASSEPQIPPDQDYENMFLGIWDCKADRSNELAFNRGDKLYVISKEFDDKSWWVAELNGKFGLVPKNYLTPAYELAR